ncbi:MAG: hypothetical protein PHC64_08535 [Candidatus Gastranaerophilales bacterium]|nr:hypothetical protein [Candidatus Gastranaerophilales bacterium]
MLPAILPYSINNSTRMKPCNKVAQSINNSPRENAQDVNFTGKRNFFEIMRQLIGNMCDSSFTISYFKHIVDDPCCLYH